MRRWPSLVGVVTGLVVAAGCITQSDAADHACEGLADRWVVLRQQVLDAVDGPAWGSAAADRHGLAMIEQARDAAAVGCSDQLAAGAPLICTRLHLLRARGPQGEAIMADLEAGCP